MLSNELITKALSLTGKYEEYFIESHYCGFGYDGPDIRKGFSVEKFLIFLLSEEFIKSYTEIHATYMEKLIFKTGGNKLKMIRNYLSTAGNIGEAIFEYQKGNEQPLQDLLNKIP